jgi:integrase/recombinase XerC
MAKIKRENRIDAERLSKVNPENIKIYDKYLRTSIVKNKEVEKTTYGTYQNYFNQFLVYLVDDWDNIDLLSKEFFESSIDIIEEYMIFCQEKLGNHGKVINTKISAVSSFYIWCVKRKLIEYHPFAGKVTRMKGANDERITKDYFLNEDQIDKITSELETNKKYDIQDRILFHLAINSANRVGAIAKLTLSSMDLDSMIFENIREKRGKRVEVMFDEKCKEYIEQWLEMRKDLDNLEIDSLFLSNYGGKYNVMAKGTIQSRARKIGELIGIDDFHMHCFRKTAINRVMTLSNDIEMAKELANHKSTDVTLLYIKPKSKTLIREKLKELKEKQQAEKDKKLEEDI